MKPDSRRRLLFVTTGLGTGGAEMMLCQLLGGLDPARFRTEVVSLTRGGKYEAQLRAMNIAVSSLGMEPGRPTPGALFRLVRVMRAFKPDVIAGWMYHGNLAALLGKWLAFRRAPVVWNVRQSLDSIAEEKPGSAAVIRLCARLSGFASAIAYNSRASARHHEIAGYRGDKTVLIPNGFDTARFAPSDEAPESLRRELDIPSGAPVVGRFGRFAPMKDYATFFRAAARVSATRPDTHFILVGTGVDPANAELVAQIAACGLASRVRLLGERQDIPRLTAGLTMACSSSAFGEGCPNVVGEAMACGVPCAVTDVGDSAWLAGGCGRVVPPRDPESLAGAILELLRMPEPERLALGRAGRDFIAAHFSLDSVIDRYSRLFENPAVAPNLQTQTQPCAA